jgi:hypothetical protein
MAQAYKILAQSGPVPITNTDLYTVPAGTQTVISTLTAVNRSSSVTTSYRIAIVPSGQTLGNQHYIAYDVPLSPLDSTAITVGITLGAGDKILCYVSAENITFNVFGVQFS